MSTVEHGSWASRLLGLLLGLLLVLMQIPAGSHLPWAVQLLALSTLLMALVALLLQLVRSLPTPRLDPLQLATIVLWLLWLAWIAVQWLPLPASLLAQLAPASFEAWTRAAAFLDQAPALRISLSPADTLWMGWLSAVYGLLYLLVLCGVRTPGSRRSLVYLLIGGAVLQSAFGTLMVVSGIEWNAFGAKTSYLGSATGTFINRNHFAGCLELGGALATGLILAQLPQPRSGGGWRRRVMTLIDGLITRSAALRVGLLVIAVGIITSRSRMGTLSFLTVVSVGSLTYLLLRGRGIRLRGLVFIATVLVIDIFLIGGSFGLDELLNRFTASKLSSDMRVSTFADLWQMVQHYWQFGSGLGSFAYTYPAFRSPQVYAFNDHAHNDYAEFLIETGVPGVAVLGLLVLTAVWRALSVLRHRKDRDSVGIALGGLLALFSISLHSLTDFNLQIPANAATVVVILALLSGLSPQSRRRHDASEAAPPEAAPVAAEQTGSPAR